MFTLPLDSIDRLQLPKRLTWLLQGFVLGLLCRRKQWLCACSGEGKQKDQTYISNPFTCFNSTLMNEVQTSSCEPRKPSWNKQFSMLIQLGLLYSSPRVLQYHYCIKAPPHKAGGAEVEPEGFLVSSSLTSEITHHLHLHLEALIKIC